MAAVDYHCLRAIPLSVAEAIAALEAGGDTRWGCCARNRSLLCWGGDRLRSLAEGLEREMMQVVARMAG